MKNWSQPRYEEIIQKNSTRIVTGLMIALVGLCLASCPPIPLISLLGSLAIFSIGIGVLNSDGLYIVFGYFFALSYCITVLLLLNYFSFAECFEWIMNFFR